MVNAIFLTNDGEARIEFDVIPAVGQRIVFQDNSSYVVEEVYFNVRSYENIHPVGMAGIRIRQDRPDIRNTADVVIVARPI